MWMASCTKHELNPVAFVRIKSTSKKKEIENNKKEDGKKEKKVDRNKLSKSDQQQLNPVECSANVGETRLGFLSGLPASTPTSDCLGTKKVQLLMGKQVRAKRGGTCRVATGEGFHAPGISS